MPESIIRKVPRPDVDPNSVPLLSAQEELNGFKTRSQIIDEKYIKLESGEKPSEQVIRRLFDAIEQSALSVAKPDKLDLTITDFGFPVAVHLRRKELPNREGKGSSPTWYYDSDSVAAINNILENTIIAKPDVLLSSSFIKTPLKDTIKFNDDDFGTTTPLKKEIIDAIWYEMEQKADAAYKQKLGTTAASRYEEISGFGKKPKDWPASDTVEIEIDNLKLSMTFARPTSEIGKKEWNVSRDSLPHLAQIYLEKLPKKPLLTMANVAVELRISKSNPDSVAASNYEKLTQLFERFNEEAGKKTTDGKTATVEMDGQKFQMEKSQGRKTWLLDRNSLPQVRAALGIAPKIETASELSSAIRGIEPNGGYAGKALEQKAKSSWNKGE